MSSPLPGAGPGNWAGAPHALLDDGVYWLSYRTRWRPGPSARRPAASRPSSPLADGERFETVATIDRDGFDSFGGRAPRSASGGGWRFYVCCATPESKHWWIEAIDEDDPSGMPAGERAVVFPARLRSPSRIRSSRSAAPARGEPGSAVTR